MSIDELVPPEEGQVWVNKNGVVISSVDTIMRWTDDWIKTAEFRQMLSKAAHGTMTKKKRRRKNAEEE